MLPVIHERLHHYPMIDGNGSLIAKDKQIIHSTAFSEHEIGKIKQLIEVFNVTCLIDSEWDYVYTGAIDHPILQNVDQGKLAQMVELEKLPMIVKILMLSSHMDQ